MSAQDHTTSVEYRTIEEYPGYRFGSDGSVWSAWTRISPRGKVGASWEIGADWWLMKTFLNRISGYLQTILRDRSGKRVSWQVHGLILTAFRGPRPEGHQACHNDGSRTNNAISNLRWDTPAANQGDRIGHGTMVVGEKHHAARLTDADVIAIRKALATGRRQKEVALEFSVSRTVIGKIGQRASWRHVPED